MKIFLEKKWKEWIWEKKTYDNFSYMMGENKYQNINKKMDMKDDGGIIIWEKWCEKM